eukprot:TRINITY_DN1815_c0_g1_i12.p7 TRINITY_DN1815_c0_g1~~TRINITY_DN1815_c0_g1_i12.p7  ORF type:complete len:100 (-),score=25.59 TRINITY_DN1815_c0_g1_i12:412-711(-)
MYQMLTNVPNVQTQMDSTDSVSPALLWIPFFFLMIRRPPRSTQSRSSAASDVYKRQVHGELIFQNEIQNRIINRSNSVCSCDGYSKSKHQMSARQIQLR